ncbi:PE-PGRS family protein [Streptomyces phaeolivaceus]|uniref:PE-PGRS family protein n=1 Tax=Streptomyces phaeolivaceus TaxID=2653200 RepID=A0A5P8KHL1_9ACTN|nr:PE-PGRS family protein [Streptomyces phaeolivaceus]QFR02108.1 PE-PGRS family protein [Streptomyces phaeolivaceus]
MSTGGTEVAGSEWAGLFVGIEALAAQPPMRRAWPHGLSRGAPADALVRLLGLVNGLVALRSLPAEVVDVALAHPERRVRLQLAEFQRDMSVDQWVRLIAGEPGDGLRRRFRALAAWHCPRVTEAEFEGWARDPDPRVRLRALWFRGLPERLATALAADPDPEVRAEACGYAWPRLAAGRRSALVDDASPQVREAARRQAESDRPMARADFDALGSTEQWRAACSQVLDRDLAEHLVHHPEYGLRMALVENERLDADLLTVPAQDEAFQVRVAVAVRPEVGEALRAEISAGLPPGTPYWRVAWVEELHDDPEAMRRLAASASVAVRRGVARARRLPPDVVDRLSHDLDAQVRSNLAQFCEGAPADLLLEVALRPEIPVDSLTHPHLPHHVLLSFADDPDPLRRRLALDAPDSTGALAERLADDPDERVRARAAADPRLSSATVPRLLDSTPRVRRAAIGNPRLPVAALVRLLRDPDTAEDAAGNPALPTTVVHRLIDLASRDERVAE